MKYLNYFLFIIALFLGCKTSDGPSTMEEEPEIEMEGALAKITGVSASGAPNNYTFSVTIESPDTGCDQYADWWEVINMEGELLYRRILAHSHVNEQPFTRTGAPVPVEENTEVIIRAHMNNLSYGSQVYRGSVRDGFTVDSLAIEFALDLETEAPLPGDCAF